jgi:hypothetical protein
MFRVARNSYVILYMLSTVLQSDYTKGNICLQNVGNCSRTGRRLSTCLRTVLRAPTSKGNPVIATANTHKPDFQFRVCGIFYEVVNIQDRLFGLEKSRLRQ